jgi:O-antigen/teichoic acid export membrane protein
MATASLNWKTQPNSDLIVPSLRHSFAWTLAGSLVYAGCQWGMLSVLAKLGSPAIVGQFALALAITAPVFMFTNLQLRGVQATDAQSEYEFPDYFTLRCLTMIAGMAIVAGVVAASRYDWTTSLVILLVAVAKAVESLSDVVAGLLQKFERLDRVAIGLMIRGGVSVSAFGIVFWKSNSLICATSALVVSWTAVVIAYDFQMAHKVLASKQVPLRFNRNNLQHLAFLALPIGIVSALFSLKANFPRYVVERLLGSSQLGILASLAYLVIVLEMISNALGQSVVARLSQMFAKRDFRQFRRLLTKLLLFGAMLCAIGVLAAAFMGRAVITMVYGPPYAADMRCFLVMVFTAGTNAIGSFLLYGLTAARNFKIQLPIVGCSVLVAIILSFALIPRYQLLGAALALLMSVIVQLLLSGLALIITLRSAYVMKTVHANVDFVPLV